MASITGDTVQVGIINEGFANFQAEIGPLTDHTITALCFVDDTISHEIEDCQEGNNHGTKIAKILLDNAPDIQFFISNAANAEELNITTNWMTAGRFENPAARVLQDFHLTPPDYEPPYRATKCSPTIQVPTMFSTTSPTKAPP